MLAIGRTLALLGRHGPALLVCSLVLGMLVAPLSAAAQRLVPASAFLLTLGSFLSAALSPREGLGRTGRLAATLIFVGAAIPAVTWFVLQAAPLDPAIELGVMVASLAPPVGSAAAIATMLGLRPRLALVVSISLTLAAPFLMPGAIALVGTRLPFEAWGLAIRLVTIVGAAALITAGVLRWRDRSRSILPDPAAAAGVSVIGLVVVGLAVTSGIAPLAQRSGALTNLFAFASAMNIGCCLLGFAAFWRWLGQPEALTIGLLSGNRNVTLAWAVAGSSLPWDTQCYLAVCVVPVLGLPLAAKAGLAGLASFRRRSRMPSAVAERQPANGGNPAGPLPAFTPERR